jgi:1-acyl-sn-glycerol-3-phosphate acyltransferase
MLFLILMNLSLFIVLIPVLGITINGKTLFLPAAFKSIVLGHILSSFRGNDFIRPLVIANQSRLVGNENVNKIIELSDEGENIIIFSNHQTEVDPQVRSSSFPE